MSSFNLRESFLDEYGAEEEQKQIWDDIMKNWDQPEAGTLQFGTPPSHALSNPGSMHVQPPQLAQQPAGTLQFATPPSHAPLNPESMDVHPPPLAQQPGTSQPSNIANAADAAKREKIRESKIKSRAKKETERKENEKRLAEVLEANERLEKEVVEAKIKQKKDEQELSNFNEEVSRLNNKLKGQTMQKRKLRDSKIIDEMAVKINEGQERIRAEMVKINEGQERIRAGQKEECIRAGQRYLKRIGAEMVGTNEAQERIRAGQKEERIRFRRCLKFQIAKARSENDAPKVAIPIKILRALINGEAEPELKQAPRGEARTTRKEAKINEGQERIRAGQKEARENFEEISKETAKLKEEENRISKQSAANQVKCDLMVQIINARSEIDAPKDAALTKRLRELLMGEAEHELKRAEHERGSKNKD